VCVDRSGGEKVERTDALDGRILGVELAAGRHGE
jgi:hypothetical protein